MSSSELDSSAVDQPLNDNQYFQSQEEKLLAADPSLRRNRSRSRMAGEGKVDNKNQYSGYTSKALDFCVFDGDDDEDAEQFIERFEFNCTKKGYNTDEEKIKILSQLAKGGFRDFLKSLKEESISGDADKDYSKYSNILTAFNSYYLGVERMKTHKGKLNLLFQKGLSVEEYSSQMQNIFSKLPSHYLGSGAKLERYIDNMEPVFREYLTEKDPKSLLRAIELAKRKERSLMSRKVNGRIAVNTLEASDTAGGATVSDSEADRQICELTKKVDTLTTLVTKLAEIKGNDNSNSANGNGNGYNNNSRSNYSNNRNRFGDDRPRTCFFCKEAGHRIYDCEKLKASSAKATGTSKPSSVSFAADKKNWKSKVQALFAALDEDPDESEDNSQVNSVTAEVEEFVSICEVGSSIQDDRPMPLTAEILIEGSIRVNDAPIDTGSAVSAIKEDIVNQLSQSIRSTVKPLTNKTVYKSASGGRLNAVGTVMLNIAIGGSSVGQLKFIVFGNLDTEMLIGMDSLRSGKFGAINPLDNSLVYQPGDSTTKRIIQLNQFSRLNTLSVDTNSLADPVPVCSIYSVNPIRLEPLSDTLIWNTRVDNLPRNVRPNELGAITMLLEPVVMEGYTSRNLTGFAEVVSHSLHQPEVPIRLINNTNEIIRLNSGTQLAVVEVVDDNQLQPIYCPPFGLRESPLEFCKRNDITINSIENDPYFDSLPDFKPSLVKPVRSLAEEIRSLVDLSDAFGQMNSDQSRRLQLLLSSKEQAFAVNPKKPTTTTHVEHHIDTGDASPINIPPYRIAKVHEEFIEDEMKGLIKNGLVVPSDSPWGFPVVVAPKKGGAKRFCIDYRRLNQVTRTSSYPLPLISDLLENFNGAKYFSSIDLASGYWQIRVAVPDQDKTTFNTKYGSFKWLVMPFGLCTAPATFQRMMDEVLGDLKWRGVCCYFDDIFIYSRTFDEHLKLIEDVLDRLIAAQLQAKVSKCEFIRKELVFVGHLVSADGIRPDPAKIDSVKNFPLLKCTRDVRSFVGLCSYYRKFIVHFSTIAAPLHYLMSDKVKFTWTDECQSAFESLKLALVNHPILVTPNFDLPFFIKTDASDKGVGFVLGQVVDGIERVISYGSKSLNRAQRKYSTSDKECYAIVYGCKANRHYLLGRPFTIYTDHVALKYLKTMKLGQDLSGRLTRYQMFLQQFEYEVVYKKGIENTDADALSRIPYASEEPIAAFSICEIEADLVDINNHSDVVVDLSPIAESVVDLSPQLLRIKRLQREDKSLFPLIKYLENKILPENAELASDIRRDAKKDYILESGILYKVWTNRNPKQMDAVWKRLVIPESVKHEILFLFHSDRYAGHVGLNKTYSKLQERYYWVNMYADTQNLVKSCRECNARKDPKKGPEVPVHMRIPDGGPFDHLVVDALGPFKTTKFGNTHIVIFIDTLTKWPECFAVKSIDAKTVARLFAEEIVPRHGCPRTLLSDRGSAFIGELMYEVYSFLNIRKLNTTAYNPQANGLVERFNHTLVNMLSMYIKDNQEDWDQHINVCQFAYRICINSSTQHSPFYMLYGREATLPVDAMLKMSDQFLDNADYVSELLRKLTSAYSVAKQNLLEMKVKREADNDELTYRLDYNVGDKVYLFVPDSKKGRSNKLRSRWHGPCEILERISPVNYRIRIIKVSGRGTNVMVVNVRRLKPVTDPNIISQRVDDANKSVDDILLDFNQYTQRAQDRALVEGDLGHRYEMERIVDKRNLLDRGIEYFVKWKNFSAKYNSWEPVANLSNASELIDDFESSPSSGGV